jgi:hypothetical protein
MRPAAPRWSDAGWGVRPPCPNGRRASFDAVAEEGPPSLREIVREFGRRTDVTPEAFGYVVTDTSDGPRYDWAPSPS